MKNLYPLLLLCVMVSPARSAEWVFGAGYADFGEKSAEDSAVASIEFHATPFFQGERFEFAWAGAFSAFGTGDAHLGAGLSGRYLLNADWFVEASVMPGVYVESNSGNDLGSAFEVRSALGVGKRLKNGSAISIMITHKSNASTADRNPGVDLLLVRWHVPLRKR